MRFFPFWTLSTLFGNLSQDKTAYFRPLCLRRMESLRRKVVTLWRWHHLWSYWGDCKNKMHVHWIHILLHRIVSAILPSLVSIIGNAFGSELNILRKFQRFGSERSSRLDICVVLVTDFSTLRRVLTATVLISSISCGIYTDGHRGVWCSTLTSLAIILLSGRSPLK